MTAIQVAGKGTGLFIGFSIPLIVLIVLLTFISTIISQCKTEHFTERGGSNAPVGLSFLSLEDL